MSANGQNVPKKKISNKAQSKLLQTNTPHIVQVIPHEKNLSSEMRDENTDACNRRLSYKKRPAAIKMLFFSYENSFS